MEISLFVTISLGVYVVAGADDAYRCSVDPNHECVFADGVTECAFEEKWFEDDYYWCNVQTGGWKKCKICEDGNPTSTSAATNVPRGFTLTPATYTTSTSITSTATITVTSPTTTIATNTTTYRCSVNPNNKCVFSDGASECKHSWRGYYWCNAQSKWEKCKVCEDNPTSTLAATDVPKGFTLTTAPYTTSTSIASTATTNVISPTTTTATNTKSTKAKPIPVSSTASVRSTATSPIKQLLTAAIVTANHGNETIMNLLTTSKALSTFTVRVVEETKHATGLSDENNDTTFRDDIDTVYDGDDRDSSSNTATILAIILFNVVVICGTACIFYWKLRSKPKNRGIENGHIGPDDCPSRKKSPDENPEVQPKYQRTEDGQTGEEEHVTLVGPVHSRNDVISADSA